MANFYHQPESANMIFSRMAENIRMSLCERLMYTEHKHD